MAAATFRAEQRAVLATLVRHLGGFQLAEDAVQDAFVSAMATWPRTGVPDRPGAWIMTTARRKAVDRLRREHAQASSRSATSIRKNPARYSLVSANGPSVICVSPSRTPAVAAMSRTGQPGVGPEHAGLYSTP